ncbi:MAG TPA: hypoxanthine phosphoribosyltransferase [Candidatus Polarisedimenticolaceae bacterium]
MRLSSTILISEERIEERVAAMADAIAADTPDAAELSVIALMDGAIMFCADLVRRLPMPVRIAMTPVLSVERGGDPGRVMLPLDFPVEGADLLLVEDILDTGRTLAALKERLERRRPRRLRIAVLLDKPARRQARIVPDYVGFQVPDKWVVGYGLDADGLYRNLPYISYVE